MKTVKSQVEFDAAYKDGERSFTIDGFHAELRENSHAELRDFSVCHQKNAFVQTRKLSPSSVVIKIDYPEDMRQWCALKGIKIKKNRARFWKVVCNNGTDWRSGTINYDSKVEIVAPDWDEHYEQECGYGLHLADSPSGARMFCDREQLKTARLLLVSAAIKDCRCFPGLPDYPMKIRARACRKVREYPIGYNPDFGDSK